MSNTLTLTKETTRPLNGWERARLIWKLVSGQKMEWAWTVHLCCNTFTETIRVEVTE